MLSYLLLWLSRNPKYGQILGIALNICCSSPFPALANDSDEVHPPFYTLNEHENEISNKTSAAKLLSRLVELDLCVITTLSQQLSEAF